MKLRHRFHWSKQQDFSFPFSIVLFNTLSFCTSIDASFLRMYFFLAIEFIKHSISNEGWSTIYYFHLKIKFSFTRLNLFSSSTPLVLEFPMIVFEFILNFVLLKNYLNLHTPAREKFFVERNLLLSLKCVIFLCFSRWSQIFCYSLCFWLGHRIHEVLHFWYVA